MWEATAVLTTSQQLTSLVERAVLLLVVPRVPVVLRAVLAALHHDVLVIVVPTPSHLLNNKFVPVSSEWGFGVLGFWGFW